MNTRALDRRLILWDPMPLPQVLAFYLGIPLLMAIVFGLNHAGLGRHFTIAQGIPYWIGIWVPMWLLLDACTRGSALALRPWSPPLWLVLLIGATAAAFASRPYVAWYVPQFRDWLPPEGPSVVPTLRGLWGELDRVLGFAGLPLFWMAINYYYDRVLGVPRYRGRLLELGATPRAPASDAPPVAEPPSVAAAAAPAASPPAIAPAAAEHALQQSGLVALLPAKVGTDVVALQAEDHYVRVFTSVGSALVRYRFGDAMRELAPLDGLQVHRSFWVRRSAVAQVDMRTSPWLLSLQGGQQIPVSQAFRAVVRASQFPDAGR
jgi:hypothetical protein